MYLLIFFSFISGLETSYFIIMAGFEFRPSYFSTLDYYEPF